MDRSYKYEPLRDAKQKLRVLELKPWGMRVPASPFTFIPPDTAPEMPPFRDNSRRPLGNDDLRTGRPMKTAKAPLEGKLFTQDIERFTKYEALSWCWPEDEERSQSISLLNANGQRTGLSISKILYTALKTLRYEDKSRFLWIDQICMDNDDPVEKKKQQLQLMTKIQYQASEHVCVYLGPGRDESDLVPHFIQTLDNYLDKPSRSPGKVRRWNAFCALMRRKWFARRWVVQEIAFAKKATLYFGRRSSIDWDLFRKAVWLTIRREDDVVRLLIEHRKGIAKPPRWDLINIRAYGAQSLLEVLEHLVQKRRNGEIVRLAKIGTLVSTLVAYDVTDSRDAIYAVLRLGRDTCNLKESSLLEADYDKKPVPPGKRGDWMYATPTITVYGKFIRYVIIESASLDILCVPWAPKLNKHDHDEEDMPSWIGSREKRPFKQLVGDGMYERANAGCLIRSLEGSVYHAAGRERLLFCQPKLDSPPPSLDGKIPFDWLHMAWEHDEALGPMKVVGEDEDIESPWGLETLPRLRSAWRARDNRGRDSQSFPHISDAFWRTLVGDRDSDGQPAPGWYRKLCRSHFRGEWKHERGRRGMVFTDEVKQCAIKKGDKKDCEFIDRLQAVTWNRRFMFTYDGRMGIVPGEAKRDDRICLLWGCTVPVGLRPVTKTVKLEKKIFEKETGEWENLTQDAEVYELIGACYVHGVMDGELVRNYPEMRKPHLWEQQFSNSKKAFGPVGNTRFRID